MNKLNSEIFSAMQTGKPLVSYKKTILGKAYVTVLNPFSGTPEGRILYGDDEDAIVDIWSEKEKAFFLRMNKNHFKSGVIIEYERPEKEEITEEEKYNSLPDEEMKKLLSSRFFTLQAALNKMTSAAPVYRLLQLAEELEKSEKVVAAIKARLSELEMDI